MPAANKPKPKPNELHLSRVYDAPVKMVWEAWADPKQAAQWWGPRGFTITTHGKDLRTGGFWSYTMHGPDGVDYPNTTKYLEVVKHSRLVYDHGGHEDRPPLFRVTVTFEEVNGKTKMDMTMALATPEAAAETKKFIKKAGGESTWDRLAEYLAKPGDPFVIHRCFEAPIAQVFRMWTDPARLTQWLPPAGFAMSFARAEIKTGGTALYSLKNGATEFFVRYEYLEVQAPSRLVFTQQFCDREGRPARPPFSPTWPETMLNEVDLVEEAPGQTLVRVRSSVHGKATEAEQKTFHDAKGSMTQGWSASFDKLEELK